MLKPCIYYRVKRNQTLREVARAFGCPASILASLNRLREEAEEGQILRIPPAENLYAVRGGESKTLLCGSPEAFLQKNGTACLYPCQQVFL